MSDYDTDIVEWSERQGALMRRLAAGELVNNAEMDWPNIAEEIETVGRNETRAVASLLQQTLLHMLKAEAWPSARDAQTWRKDAANFREQAAEWFAPSMRQKIDLTKLLGRARRQMPDTVEGVAPLPTPETDRATLDDLLRDS